MQLATARSELALALLAQNRREEARALLDLSYPVLMRHANASARVLQRAQEAHRTLQ